MTLIINLPGNDITGPCFNSILKFVYWTQKYKDFKLIMNNSGGSHVGFVRERLMGGRFSGATSTEGEETVFDGVWPDYDYILWIDSDIKFEPEDVATLIDDNQDIVAGYYKVADGLHNSCCLEVDDAPEAKHRYMSIDEIEARIPRGELIDTQHCGFGFVLIKKGVFEKVPKPYFLDQTSTHKDGSPRYLGEDVAFCHRVRKAGFKIYTDPRVRVWHFKRYLV